MNFIYVQHVFSIALSGLNIFVIAGVDYDVPPNVLEFSSSVVSNNISIGIMADNLNEIEEYFDVVIADVFIKNASGAEIHLSDEERSRILTEGHARIFIRDRKFS